MQKQKQTVSSQTGDHVCRTDNNRMQKTVSNSQHLSAVDALSLVCRLTWLSVPAAASRSHCPLPPDDVISLATSTRFETHEKQHVVCIIHISQS